MNTVKMWLWQLDAWSRTLARQMVARPAPVAQAVRADYPPAAYIGRGKRLR